MIADPAREADLHAEVAGLGSIALRATDVVTVVEAACRSLSEALASPSAVVLRVVDTPIRRLVLSGGIGVPPGMASGDDWPVQAGGVGEFVLRTGEIGELSGSADDELVRPEAMRRAGFQSAIAVPIPVEGQTWGILSVASAERSRFVGVDRDFVLSVGNVLAAFLERDVIQERLLHQSLHDALTGLPNRVLLLDRLEQAQERCRRDGKSFVVMVGDLDNFKDVNDGYGHAAGDEVLRQAAARFQQVLRPGDTVCRLGGDEFVLVCEDLEAGIGAETMVQRVRQAMAPAFDLPGGNVEIHLTMSLGLTRSRTGDDVSELMQEADTAMYLAKRAGGNTWSVYEHGLRLEAQARALEAGELRAALDEDQLRVYYQPVVDAGLHIVGVEALIRWQHPLRGLIGADQVIPAAERTGMIGEIGSWVRRTATAQVAHWQRQSEESVPPLRLAVNISVRELARPALIDAIVADIASAAIADGTLDLELTESVLVGDTLGTADALARFRAAGARTMIDDFGTGYCSLSLLRDLPISGVKIDRSFTAGLPGSATDLAIIRSVTGLADSLGLTVVAEGVETQAQWTILTELGCSLAQGYLWSRPVTPARLQELLQRQSHGGSPWGPLVT